MCSATAPAMAEDRTVPGSRAQVALSFAPVVKRAAPAVVNVYVRKRVTRRNSPFLDDPFFRRFFGDGLGVPRERVQNSLGSGVIVSPEGVVVTNHHVVGDAKDGEIIVALSDKREFPAKILLKDKRTDLAVLRVESGGKSFPYLKFADSDAIEVGDLVLAIGDPFGVGQTVTSGIVSALARTRVGISNYQFFIQTDAAINPGNSGGALVDVDGQLLGINTAIYSRTGASHGIGFAIPANMVRLVVGSAMKGRTVRRPWLGARLQPVTRDIANSLGLDRPSGAVVADLRKDGPAQRAGLRVGDVIIGVAGYEVGDPRAFNYRFATQGLGGKAPIKVLRKGRERKVRITLETAPEDPPRNETRLTGRTPFSGAKVANLSPALAEELSVEDAFEGVVVLDIPPNSAAGAYRLLRRGDIILAINGERIKSARHLAKIMQRPVPGWRVSLRRRGRVLTFYAG